MPESRPQPTKTAKVLVRSGTRCAARAITLLAAKAKPAESESASTQVKASASAPPRPGPPSTSHRPTMAPATAAQRAGGMRSLRNSQPPSTDHTGER